MRIAIVNWRDPWRPERQDEAERYAWAMATSLASRGARSSYLTARAPGQAPPGPPNRIEIILRLRQPVTV